MDKSELCLQYCRLSAICRVKRFIRNVAYACLDVVFCPKNNFTNDQDVQKYRAILKCHNSVRKIRELLNGSNTISFCYRTYKTKYFDYRYKNGL